MASLDGKVALITGASRGIGRAVAERMGRERCRIIVNYAQDMVAAEATVAAVKVAGGDAVSVQGDTTDPASIRDLFEAASSAFGGLDILVNNAHEGSGHGLIVEVPEAAIDQQLKVLKGYILCMQEGARRLRDGGAVINLSSSTTHLIMPQNCIYSAVKAAIEQISRHLSTDLAVRGISVNSVAPGRVDTDRMRVAPRAPVGATPFARAASAQEIAEVICFLATPAGSWINRQTIFANGGVAYAQ